MLKSVTYLFALTALCLSHLRAGDVTLPPQTVTDTQNYSIEGSITATSVNVTGNGQLNLTSNREIHLTASTGSPFHVEAGSNLHAKIGPVPPAAPSNLSATLQNGVVHLTWTDNSNIETGFVIERKLGTNGGYMPVLSPMANVTSTDDTTSPPFGTNYYHIKAVNPAGSSAWSNEVSVTLTPAITLSADQTIRTKIDFTWTGNPFYQSYSLERSSDGILFNSIAQPAISSASDTQFQEGVLYYYRVSASSPFGNFYSQVVTACVNPQVPVLTISSPHPQSYIGSNSATIVSKTTWGIWPPKLMIDGQTLVLENPAAPAVVSTINGLLDGYHLAGVVSKDTDGSLKATFWNFNTATQQPVLATLAITPEYSSMNAGTSRTFVVAAFDQYNQPFCPTLTWSTTSGTIDIYGTMTINSTADACVATVSAASDTLTAVVYVQINAGPSQLKAVSTSSTKIDLTWISNSNDDAVFAIERKEGNFGTFTQIGTAGTLARSFSDTNLSPNQCYYYRVKAVNILGDLPYSNEATAATAAAAGIPPVAQPILTAEAADDVVNLSWADPDANVTRYLIERRSANGIYEAIDAVGADRITYQDSTVQAGVQYFYRIQAANAAGSSPYSNEADAVCGNLNAPTLFDPLPGPGWQKTNTQQISVHVSGDSIDYSSARASIIQCIGDDRISLSGVQVDSTGNLLIIVPTTILGNGYYEISVSICNAFGVKATISWSFNIDITPPVISGFPDALTQVDSFPTITTSYSDAISGVAQVFLLNGTTDVTNTDCVVGNGRITYQPQAPLSPGQYALALHVIDYAGNETISPCVLTITGDITPPTFGASSPPRDGFRSCGTTASLNKALLSITYSDADSGVDPAQTQIQIDHDNPIVVNDLVTTTSFATATGMCFSLKDASEALPDGWHIWTVYVRDRAGNWGVFQSTFYLDSTAPIIVNTWDFGIVGANPLNHLELDFADNGGSGIDWSTLTVSMDTSNGTIPVTFAPVNELSNGHALGDISHPVSGPRTIHVTVGDFAGNTMHSDLIQTPAIYNLQGQSPLGTWAPFENDTQFAGAYDSTTWQHLRMSFADGFDPADITIWLGTSECPTQIITIDTDNHIVEIAFQKFGPDTNYMHCSIAGTPCIMGFYENSSPYIGIDLPFNQQTTNQWAPIQVSIGDTPPYSVAPLSKENYARGTTILVDGIAQAAVFDGPDYAYISTVQPIIPWAVGAHHITATFTDFLGNQGYAEADFTVVADPTPPTIDFQNANTYSGDTHPQLHFQVYDFPNGVKTVSVNGLPCVPVATDSAMNRNANYVFVDPQARSDGDEIVYHITAVDYSNNETDLDWVTIVDLSPPTIFGMTWPDGWVDPSVTQLSFQVQDAGVGVYSVDATLNGNAVVHSILPHQSEFDINNLTLIPYKRYTLDVSAVDLLQHPAMFHKVYIAAKPNDPPVITIFPIDGGNPVTSLSGQVQIVDAGCGVSANNVVITFDADQPGLSQTLIPTHSGNDVTTGVLTLDFKLPPVLNGWHTVSATAVDNNSNTGTAQSHFSLEMPLPAKPVADFVATGTYYVTVIGHVPPVNNVTLSDLEVIVPSAMVGNAPAPIALISKKEFNAQTGQFKLVFAKTIQNTISFQLVSHDTNGYESDPNELTASFTALQPGQSKTPPGQIVGTTLPPPPANATQPADSTGMSLYWDFHPDDITGVTKPNISIDAYSLDGTTVVVPDNSYRGWIPATKKGTIRIEGIVRGGQPPYSLSLSGYGISYMSKSINSSRFEFTLDVTEGLKRGIQITASDVTGIGTTSFPRDIFADRTQPPT